MATFTTGLWLKRFKLPILILIGFFAVFGEALTAPTARAVGLSDDRPFVADFVRRDLTPIRFFGLTASITTDRQDYRPGAVAVITGSGFLPGETVRLQVVHLGPTENLTPHQGHDPWDVVADGSGGVSSSWLVDEDSLNQTLLLTADGLGSLLHAEHIFTDASGVDFRQCANKDAPFPLGHCNWINSIVQSSNARYFEGMSNMQRIMFTNVTPTADNVHRLTLSHQYSKGGTHAYDFLTSYEQAIKAGADAGVPYVDTTAYTPLGDENPAVNLTLTTVRACGANIGPPGNLGAICSAVRNSGNKFNVPIPDDPYIDAGEGTTQTRINAYEAVYGNRYLRIYADAPITAASMSLAHSGADTGDSDVNYILSWTSSASSVLIEVAGHLSVTGDGTGVTWFEGSSQINGGPYHFNLYRLNTDANGEGGESLGSQDNQIKGADILIIPPQGAITIQKDAIPDDAQDFSFTTTDNTNTPINPFILDDDGDVTQPNQRTFTGLEAGQYTITEGAVAGWDLTNLECQVISDANYNVDLVTRTITINLVSPTGSIVCTFTNRKEGRIEVEKQTLPNASTQSFNFDGAIDVNLTDGQFSGVNVDPGQYSVNEVVPTGWDLTSIVCDDGASTTPSTGNLGTSTATFNVEPGETVRCVFTNTQRGHIIVDKVTVPGGDPQSFGFTTTGSGYNPFSLTDAAPANDQEVLPGAYTVAETPVAGWTLTSAVCDNGEAPNSIDVGPGETITCVFTNTKQGKVLVDKITVPAADPQSFDFTSSFGPFALTDQSALFDSGSIAPGTYSVAETGETGWDLTSATCSDGSPVNAIAVAAGETVTCTFTNTKRGSITIVKDAVPNDAQDFSFTATEDTDTLIPDFSLDDDADPTLPASRTFENLKPGSYTVTEDGETGWTLTGIVCGAGGTPSGSTANIVLPAGGSVTCTFTNRQPDAQIDLDPLTATNEVGDAHVITATVQQDDMIPAGAPGDGANGFGPAPDGTLVTFSLLNNTAGAAFVGGVNTCTTTAGTCSVSINTTTPGGVDIHATTTFDVLGVSLTRATGTGGLNSADAHKTYVDGQIDVTPLTDTNRVNEPHVITATVLQDDGYPAGAPGDGVTGFGPVPNGTLVTFSLLNNTAGAAFVNGVNTCVTAAGSCSVSINTTTAGSVDIRATSTFSVGGVSLTRTTGSGGLNSADANKIYVDAQIDVTPLEDTNPVNEPHTFTATVLQDDGRPAGAPGDAVTGFGPAPDGTTVTFAFVQNTIGAVFVGGDNDCTTVNGSCSVQINSSAPGVLIVSATTTFNVGGLSMTRTTGTGGLNSPHAQKTYVAGVIIVDKVTVPAGDPELFDFTTNYGSPFSLADQTAPNNSGNLAPGTYSVSEAAEAGWDLTSAVCSDGSPVNAIDLAAGETITCTFTNTKRGKILVDKVTNPAGSTQLFEFDPSYNAANFFLDDDDPVNDSGSLMPGNYSVAEVNIPTGWVNTAATCSDGSPVNAIALGAGETVTCTFTNQRLPQLRLIKDIVPNTDTGKFDLRDGGTVKVDEGGDNADSGFFFTGIGSHTVDELAGSTSPTTLGDYISKVVCDSGKGSADPGTSHTFSLAYTEVVTCTFTNTRKATVQVIKTFQGGPITGPETFTFTLRTGASATQVGNILETQTANSTNGGTLNFTTKLTPGTSYQICEVVMVGWNSSISSLPGAFVIQTEPDGDNSTYCVAFTPTAGENVVITIDNTPPPGGDARTIGYWKNWSSCTRGNQAPVLDYILWSYSLGHRVEVELPLPGFPAGPYVGTNLGGFQVTTCAAAYNILSKRLADGTAKNGRPLASNPAVNMAAQLLAAKLNIQASADPSCIQPAITLADQYLVAVGYNGTTAPSFPKPTGDAMNFLAGLLDDYNNNTLSCPLPQLPPTP